MSLFHTQVTLDGYDYQDQQFTVKVSAGLTTADAGKAMSQDTATPNSMKLVLDGEPVEAILVQVETRQVEGNNVGLVSWAFSDLLPIAAGLAGADVVAIGSRVCGSTTPGSIRAAHPTDPLYLLCPKVWEIRGSNAVVLKTA